MALFGCKTDNKVRLTCSAPQFVVCHCDCHWAEYCFHRMVHCLLPFHGSDISALRFPIIVSTAPETARGIASVMIPQGHGETDPFLLYVFIEVPLQAILSLKEGRASTLWTVCGGRVHRNKPVYSGSDAVQGMDDLNGGEIIR